MPETHLGKRIFECWSVATLGMDREYPIPKSALIKPKSSKWQRGVAAIKVINSVPGLQNLVTETVLKSEELPLSVQGQCWKYVSRGEEQMVFRVSNDNKDGDYVLKVNLETLIQPNADAISIGKETKADYDEIRETYKEVPVDIPDQDFVVLAISNSFTDKKVLGVIEPYDTHDRIDIFDLNEEVTRCLDRKTVQRSIVTFAHKFVETLDRTGRFIDIVGPSNVCIRSNPQTGEFDPNIMITDPHVIYGKGSYYELGNEDSKIAQAKIQFLRNIACIAIN